MHYINKCSCGAVISQCRCIGNRTETIIPNGCKNCHDKVITLSRVQPIKIVHGQPYTPPTNSNWNITKDGTSMEVTYEDMKQLYSELHEIFHGDD